jgi:endo-1,4-beta-mannosidase
VGEEIDMSEFRLGVNYWPARSAMDWWEDFDPAEWERDLARLADWGFHDVRIFLHWETFQPAPDRISDAALRRLETALTIGHQRGIGIVPSLFCGHMSGVNWLPGWAIREDAPPTSIRTVSGGKVVTGGAGDIYGDPALVDAQVFQAHRLATAFRGHPALAGWDLGNEPSLLRLPSSPEMAARWSERLTQALRAGGIEVTGGLHSPDLERDQGIRIGSISRPWDFVSMHGYPLYTPIARRPDDPEWVPFVCATAARFAGKPVLAQEFGLPDHELGEVAVARYAEAVLQRLWWLGARGAYWWCFTDYASALRTMPPFDHAAHELHFGLLRSDGSPKPVLDAWRAFGRREVLDHPIPGGPDEEAWYAGLPETARTAYAAWIEERSVLQEVSGGIG